MKKLVVIWENGDKEEVEVTEEYMKTHDFNHGFRNWGLLISQGDEIIGCLNLEYARKVYYE